MTISQHSILPPSAFADDEFLKFFVGLDKHLENFQKPKGTILKSQTKYPPYNIKCKDNTEYVIEFAVAGFKQEDLDVQLQNRILTVTGKVPEDSNQYTYDHRGLATRAFTSHFSIAENIETTGVLLQDGLLKIFLKYVVPEELKPKKLEINSNMSKLLLG